MTAHRQRYTEAYLARLRELRQEQVDLANGEGEQLALPGVEAGALIRIHPDRWRRRGTPARRWVQP